MTEETINTTVYAMAKGFKERAEVLGLKGKRRDNDALTYFVGAAKALEFAGERAQANALAGAAFLLSLRGYSEIEEILTKKPAAAF